MDTQHCLQCELHKDRIDQFGCKYCYCFFNPDKGRWVTEIENCPKHEKQSVEAEKPIQEGLKEEIESYWKENGPMSHAEYDRLVKCARHFYEIGCRRTAEKYDEIEYERQRAEESVLNELEEAAVNIADELLAKPKDYALSAKADYWNGVHDGAIAGAKWQEEKEKEYSPWLAIPKLKEAALEFGEQAKDCEIGGQSFAEDMAVAFTRGAEWQKGQMMDEAVEGEVKDFRYLPEVNYSVAKIEFAKIPDLKEGDKVKIIIVKEGRHE